MVRLGMDLIELKPQFLKIVAAREYNLRDELEGADGILFLCPVCFRANGGPAGTHSIICWQPHVPQDMDPKPGRWAFKGTGFGDLTLVAGSSSVFLQGAGCKAHFFIRDGKIE
jgi:hypothetical protein